MNHGARTFKCIAALNTIMAHKSYQHTIATDVSGNRDVAIAAAAQSLKRLHDSLDGRRFKSNIMDVYVYEGEKYAIAFDVMYEAGDGDYFNTIERRFDMTPSVEGSEEVFYEPA